MQKPDEALIDIGLPDNSGTLLGTSGRSLMNILRPTKNLIFYAAFIACHCGQSLNSWVYSQISKQGPSAADLPQYSVPLARSALIVRPDGAMDPDDMCFIPSSDGDGWIIASDKKAELVFLLDSSGKVLDRISIPKPGNIDSRPQVRLFGKDIPLIVVNQRSPDPQLRAMTISHVDGTAKFELIPSFMPTGQNYGGCLSLNKEGQVFFFSTTEGGEVQQFEIIAQDQSLVSRRCRAWNSPICEGTVSDDDAGVVFLTEETIGIRKVSIDPNQPVGDDYILKVGEHGVTGDLEGITILRTGPVSGFLIASDQGRSQFIVLDRQFPHSYIGSFQVEGANHTDGVDIANFAVGKRFERGVFACHTDSDAQVRSIVLVHLNEILKCIEALVPTGK